MARTRIIDFIRHANASDRNHTLSILGIYQALAFGKAQRRDGKQYQLFIISGTNSTYETLKFIIKGTGWSLRTRMVIPEMFDPKKPDEHSERRQAAYRKLGETSLQNYHSECKEALVSLAEETKVKLQGVFNDNRENVLVIGHAPYINQIIITTFGIKLNPIMALDLLTDSFLGECAGYRLMVNDNGEVEKMIKLHSPRVPTIT